MINHNAGFRGVLERYSEFNRKMRNFWAIAGFVVLIFFTFVYNATSLQETLFSYVLIIFTFLVSTLHYILFVLGERYEEDDNVFLALQRNSLNSEAIDFEKSLNLPTKVIARMSAFDKHR